MKYRLALLVWLLAAAAACNSKSSSHAVPIAKASHDGHETRAGFTPLDPREQMLAQGLLHLLESEHLLQRPVDDEVSRKAFAQYLRMLDPSKMFLLASQVAELETHADRMDDQLRAGQLELARTGAEILAERRARVARLVEARLAEPFDFTRDETLETDPDKVEYAAGEEELADRWRRHLKLQALERIARMEETAEALAKAAGKSPDEARAVAASLDEIPPTFEGREKKAREDLAQMYSGRFARLARAEPLRSLETFLNAIATVYDPHTVYMAPVDKQSFDIQMSGQLEGIGAVLAEEDHYIAVREIVPGGASWRQGKLEAGDLILAVAQDGEDPVDVADMPIDQVVQMIRGPKGTVVVLTIKKPDGRVEILAITRDVVEIESSYARGAVLDAGSRQASIGYIYLPSFYGSSQPRRGGGGERNAADDVRTLLETFRDRKIPGVVIDLRGNGGGLLDHARDITGLLIDTGPVVKTRYSDGRRHVLRDSDPGVSYDGEVVVLVDRFSASASEIVAGALQDYRRAVVVGTGPTHGKGTVQALLDLDRMRTEPGKPLGVLKLTIQQFFRVSGKSTQWRGITPDIILPDPVAHIESGERYLDNSIPWSKVNALDFKPWSRSGWNLEALVAASNKRRVLRPVFAKIDARTAYLKSRRAQTLVPLERDKWLARRERERKALEAVDPELSDSPERFKVAVVDYSGKAAPRRPGEADGKSSAAEQLESWRKDLARDPWVEEAMSVVADMAAARRGSASSR